MTIFDYNNESSWWTLVFVLLIFEGIESCIKAWNSRK